MAAASGHDISIHMYRYPLHDGLQDITFKWNALIADAYIDGSDYLYQFSDDTTFLVPGWPEHLVGCLESQGGFRMSGLVDKRNNKTMTLAMSGRMHLDISGPFGLPSSRISIPTTGHNISTTGISAAVRIGTCLTSRPKGDGMQHVNTLN